MTARRKSEGTLVDGQRSHSLQQRVECKQRKTYLAAEVVHNTDDVLPTTHSIQDVQSLVDRNIPSGDKIIGTRFPAKKSFYKGRNARVETPPWPESFGVSTSLKKLSVRSKLRRLVNRAKSNKSPKMKSTSFLTCGQAALMDVSQITAKLDVDLDVGLGKPELGRRRDIHGANEVSVPDPEPIWKKYLEQFNNPLIYLLLGSAFISTCMAQFDDAISITAAMIIVVTVGFVQEYRSEKTLERMGALLPPTCNVLRDGALKNMLAKHLVPGDVVHLSIGDRIPADLRMCRVNELGVDESSLTGEPVIKAKCVDKIVTKANDPRIVEITDMENICFQGTLVTEGKGVGVVVATGENSQFGAIF